MTIVTIAAQSVARLVGNEDAGLTLIPRNDLLKSLVVSRRKTERVNETSERVSELISSVRIYSRGSAVSRRLLRAENDISQNAEFRELENAKEEKSLPSSPPVSFSIKLTPVKFIRPVHWV
jgi:hypothetical protein